MAVIVTMVVVFMVVGVVVMVVMVMMATLALAFAVAPHLHDVVRAGELRQGRTG